MRNLTIIFPLYNEADRLKASFAQILRVRTRHPHWQWLFVNDGSTDETLPRIRQLIQPYPRMHFVSYPTNKGKGYAIAMGVRRAKTTFILFSDIDLSTPLSELDTFFPFMDKGADVVIGTRKVMGARLTRRQPAFREWCGRQFTQITNLWFGLHYTDYTCGFKLFRTACACKLFSQQSIHRWAFDAEILFLAHQLGYAVTEVPVTWHNDQRTKVHLIRDIGFTIWELLKIRWYWLNHLYPNPTN